MINLAGSFLRAIWYLVFSAAALSGTNIPDSSKFCQVTGFFFSAGHEATDLCVLFIAIHGTIQVYRPVINRSDPNYGLNPYRIYVSTSLICIPILLAGLAWVNGNIYVAMGSVCWLPIRPIWYRLALSWIPRYVVFLVTILLTLAVYTHMEKQIKGFEAALGEFGGPQLGTGEVELQSGQTIRNWAFRIPKSNESAISDSTMSPIHGNTMFTRLGLNSRRDARVQRRLSRGENQHIRVLEASRARLRSKLLLNFIYVVVYIALWIIPFVLHCMQYRFKYAMRPPPVLAALSTFCIASMGFANGLCFLVMEKPWKDLDSSDS
jgi:G protein-coupled receptor GPR1